MTEKLTPEEIKKALECCTPTNESCLNCPLINISVPECAGILYKETLDLINRQQAEIETMLKDLQFRTNQVIEQEAEIERLTINMNAFGLGMKQEKERADTIRSEAIKEFAERLKEHLKGNGGLYCVTTMNAKIDILVKEMAGDDK